VIGATTADQLSMEVDPSTLETVDASTGTVITSSHIHHAIRDLAGLSVYPEQFPLTGSRLALFG